MSRSLPSPVSTYTSHTIPDHNSRSLPEAPVRLRTWKLMMNVALAFAFGVGGCGSSTPRQPISVLIDGGSSTIVPNGTFSLTAVVSSDSSGSGVTWSLAGAGTLTLQTGTSATYTAPASAPANAMVSITATSVTDGTKSNVLQFSIVAQSVNLQCQPSRGNESALATPFAFLLKGSAADGTPIAYVGSFTADGTGGITAGDVDVVGVDTGPEELPVSANVSYYSYDSDGRGCVNLQFDAGDSKKVSAKATRHLTKENYLVASNGLAKRARGARERTANAIHAADSEENLTSLTLSFVLGSPTGPGRIIKFADGMGNPGIVSGQIHAQSPADFSVSKLSSRYAFGADGWSPAQQGDFYRAAIAGSFANNAGHWSLGVADEIILTTASNVSGGEGGVDATIDSTTGRGTGSYETGKSGGVDFDFAYYIVDARDFYFISSDDVTSSAGILAGRALEAVVTSTPLNGYYITASSGYGLCESCDSMADNAPSISTMHATSTGSATGTITGGSQDMSPSTYTWTYTLDAASGRLAFAGGSSLSIAYLTSGTSDDGFVAFTVGADDFSTSSGFIASAGTSAPNYSAASLSGAYAYGSAEDASAGVGSAAGVATFDGTSSFTVLADTVVVGDEGTTSKPDAFVSGAYIVNADGTGTLNNPSTVFVTNGNLIVAFNNSGLSKLILEIYIRQSSEPDKTKITAK
jgi:hypothetical protein